MLVIADASPVIVLVNTGYVEVLPRLFGRVIVPPEVMDELGRPNRPAAVREFMSRRPDWMEVRAPAAASSIANLHAGETAAIQLATELRADLLLIDEVQGRRLAAERHIRLTGTVGVLELAATQGLLDLREAFDRVRQTDFWISPALLDARLTAFLRGK